MMKNRMKKNFLALALLSVTLCGCTGVSAQNWNEVQKETVVTAETESFRQNAEHPEGYTLKEVVVLSRHNIRSPLSGKGSALDEVTEHDWFDWTSNTSELSLRGGVLETMMGQYFRQWLESEELIPENYIPAEDEVRIYANSKQRTLATAQYFSSGLLPVADIEIEHHMEYDVMDPVFTPKLTYISDAYTEEAKKEMKEIEDSRKNLSDAYDLVADVIDFQESEGYQSGKYTDFKTGDSEYVLELDKEPGVKGSLKTACTISDALVLQYYEEEDAKKAAFDNELSFEDWQRISEVKDDYGDVLFSAPVVSVNVAHPLLKEIESELNQNGRKFTFLCGHDSNIVSVLAALDAEEYTLPQSIESKTPIGSKLVFEKWEDKNGEEYLRIRLVYQSADQLRDAGFVTMDTPPVSYELSFSGLKKNEKGLYRFSDFEERLQEKIRAYDELKTVYGEGETVSEASAASEQKPVTNTAAS